MKLLIHSETTTVQQLKIWIGQLISLNSTEPVITCICCKKQNRSVIGISKSSISRDNHAGVVSEGCVKVLTATCDNSPTSTRLAEENKTCTPFVLVSQWISLSFLTKMFTEFTVKQRKMCIRICLFSCLSKSIPSHHHTKVLTLNFAAG